MSKSRILNRYLSARDTYNIAQSSKVVNILNQIDLYDVYIKMMSSQFQILPKTTLECKIIYLNKQSPTFQKVTQYAPIVSIQIVIATNWINSG